MHPQLTPKDITRFWSHVHKTENATDCWLCDTTPSQCYGLFSVGNRLYTAHRISYELAHGPIAEGLFVCHACDTPRCVNPAHLWLGTQADNQADMARKKRAARGLANGQQTHPEKRPRGDDHWARRRPEKVLRGEAKWQAKLTAEQVREIRARYAAGARKAHLAKSFGVHPRTIDFIVRRVHWADLDA